MPIPGEQPELSAPPPESSPVKRRLAAQYVREARDRLLSSSGTRPAFDYELLRQYAQNRPSAVRGPQLKPADVRQARDCLPD